MKGPCRTALMTLVLGMTVIGMSASAQNAPSNDARQQRLRDLLQRRRNAPTANGSTDVKTRITKAGDYRFSFEHDGLARAYLVHVPSRYQPEHQTPLLIALHGGGGSMDYQASDENYGQISKSDREGFIVVFPNGFSRLPGGLLATWNAGNCCGQARDRNVDDVGFIRQMIANLTQQLNIDRQKIFATGMSNGGLLAHRLACEMADTFTAIATVAGTDNTTSCHPVRPISVLAIHAKNDDQVLFDGGKGPKVPKGDAVTDFTSEPESIARWVRRNGCSATPTRVLDKPGAYCDQYASCQGHVAVELCATERGAHSWPGASKWRSSEPPSTAISANDVMWDFFMTR